MVLSVRYLVFFFQKRCKKKKKIIKCKGCNFNSTKITSVVNSNRIMNKKTFFFHDWTLVCTKITNTLGYAIINQENSRMKTQFPIWTLELSVALETAGDTTILLNNSIYDSNGTDSIASSVGFMQIVMLLQIMSISTKRA